MLTISVTGKLVNGRPDTGLEGSKILVTIKKGGAKTCGADTPASAPSANVNAATKVWRGNDAVSLLGQECTLPVGDYELCVQLFGQGAAGVTPLSEEKRKSFSIKAGEQVDYQATTLIMPVDGSAVDAGNLKKPIDFRWTPVIPRPTDPTTYRLRVWQLMQGQNGRQAMKANMPIVTKNIENLTQTTIDNLLSEPCKPPHLCEFIWNVQALNREGKPIGENNGTSGTSTFHGSSGFPVGRD